jgi:DNA mismatch repair protein MutS
MIDYDNLQVKDFFKIYQEQKKKYGDNTLFLMQVGSFHEMYCTETFDPPLNKIAELLDIVYTKKNKKKPVTESNPYMLGFPTHSLAKFVDILVKNQLTLVIADQVSEPPKPIRKITQVLTPSTYLENKTQLTKGYGNYLVSLVIEKGINMKKEESIIIGISAIDLTIGKTYYHEGISQNYDSTYSLDDACRFLQRFPPCEVIWTHLLEENTKINRMSLEDVTEYLNLPRTTHYHEFNKIKDLMKISFQKKKFQEIFKSEIPEMENLDIWNYARFSLILAIYYIERINPTLLEKLNHPELFSNETKLHLGNKALTQLNFLDEEGIIKIIDKTSTIMGKRFLLENLSNPLTSIEILNQRYQDIEKIKKDNEKIKNHFSNLYDLDKLIRKIELLKIQPNEIAKLSISLEEIEQLEKELKNFINKDLFKTIKEINQDIKKTFNLEKILSMTKEKENIFNNVFPEINLIQDKLNLNEKQYQKMKDFLENFLEEGKFIKNKEFIKIERNTLDGVYLSTTEKRGKKVEEELNKNKNLLFEKVKIREELEFIYRNKNCKIKGNFFNNLFEEKLELEKTIQDLISKYYLEFIEKLTLKTSSLKLLSSNIAYLDFITSGSLLLDKYHYSLPTIKELSNQESYFQVKNLRHPLVERISSNDYIPQTLSLGKDIKGMVLYGVNSAGKSTLMKSLGINIILAQIGYPVSAEELIYYPYHAIFTRIIGNDNIYSGLSSFMVEMIELNAILNRNNKNTLVIADELCRGTEVDSANIIVVYMIEELAKNHSSFITASHLHQIMNFDSIKKLTTVKAYHLDVEYRNKNLIYDRKLKEGQGKQFYGLEIAKYIIEDKEFMERTNLLTNKLEEIKTSKYNSNLILEKCEICHSKKNLETHHIVFQKDFDKNKINKNKYHLIKNDLNNLVCLCQKCHDEVDRKNIEITGWKNHQLVYTKTLKNNL